MVDTLTADTAHHSCKMPQMCLETLVDYTFSLIMSLDHLVLSC